MPTGGVTIDNAAAWLSLPEVSAAGGTWLNKADAEGIRKAVELAKSL
jgi:KDPG and KHG aldolase.